MPKVSVIVNCFNGEQYLKQALDSIYGQTFTDWEIIFFDNCSSDRSAEIAALYDSKLIYYKNSETIPLGHARYLAVNMANGEWIAFLDTDDYWFPNNLAEQLDLLAGTEYILSYAGIREINEEGEMIRDYLPEHQSGYIFPSLLNQFDINMVTPLIKRQALSEFNLNFEPIITASEEYNLFMRLAAKGGVSVVSKVLGVYRVSKNSLTNKQISKWAYERYFTLDQLCKENPGLEEKFYVEFEEARARGKYYEARYYMFLGDSMRARKTLKEIRKHHSSYGLLYHCALWPGLWNFLHNSSLKRKLSSLFGR